MEHVGHFRLDCKKVSGHEFVMVWFIDHMLWQTARNFPWAATEPDFKLAERPCDPIDAGGHVVSGQSTRKPKKVAQVCV